MIEFNEEEVKKYLDDCIRHWRAMAQEARDVSSKDPNRMFPAMQSTSQLKAESYVDAFQTVRGDLFGEMLD